MRLVIRSEIEPDGDISLSGEKILVGHERSQCDYYVPQSEWPMVAGLHAEFRIVNGICYLADLKTDSGTYVDKRRITQAVPIRVGSQVQFGLDGPMVTVLRVEVIDSMPRPPEPAPPRPAPEPPTDDVEPEPGRIILPRFTKHKRPPVGPAYVELLSDHRVNVRRLDLNKELVRLGRSPEMDLVFDGAASFISREHAEVRRSPEGYVLSDLKSFNGTLLNGTRLTGPRLLKNGDRIQLGLTGPSLRFVQLGIVLPQPAPLPLETERPIGLAPQTAYYKPSDISPPSPAPFDNREPVFVLPFDGRQRYLVGRSPESEVRLDGLQISKHHAWFTVLGSQIFIEDNQSTNGLYVNGMRLLGKMMVQPLDTIQIGPFILHVEISRGIEVFDTRAKMRVDSVGLTKVVPSNTGSGTVKLLDNLSFTIQPNEFIGLLGPSGAGKSTLIDALNGMRRATAGQVLLNNLDLYQNLEWLKQSIGYVPQDDIIHRELSVHRTLYYVAKLRLSQDVSETDLDLIVKEVLDLTDLTERRNAPVSQLSGGQRKRVSVAVELLTKPSVIYLDEPTSGLDPATEEKIMRLFRQIADGGHTVILTTHAMENVKLFHKIILLMQGKLVFFGEPAEALSYVKSTNFKDLYDKLEEPVLDQMRRLPPSPESSNAPPQADQLLVQVKEAVAESWKQRYLRSTQYEKNVQEPQTNLPQFKAAPPRPKEKPSVRYALRQCSILAQRYREVMQRDRLNLSLLFGQAAVIAGLTWLAVAADAPRDFLYFILALVPVWFGTSIAAREIIRERPIYNRERMVNLGLWPYIGSKMIVLGVIVGLQCLILFGTLTVFSYFGVLKLPGILGGLPQLAVMMLAGLVGIALGLLVSALVRTSEMATSLVPLLLIPQILFSGLIGVPKGVTRTIGLAMPVTWSFDEMKRLSARDVEVLEGEDEGAAPAYNNEGRGLYKQTRYKAQRAMEDYEQQMKARAERQQRARQPELESGDNQSRRSNSRANIPRTSDAKDTEEDLTSRDDVLSSVPDDLSAYVRFLHPLGSVWLNPMVLLLMLASLLAATLVILRRQDVRN